MRGLRQHIPLSRMGKTVKYCQWSDAQAPPRWIEATTVGYIRDTETQYVLKLKDGHHITANEDLVDFGSCVCVNNYNFNSKWMDMTLNNRKLRRHPMKFQNLQLSKSNKCEGMLTAFVVTLNAGPISVLPRCKQRSE